MMTTIRTAYVTERQRTPGSRRIAFNPTMGKKEDVKGELATRTVSVELTALLATLERKSKNLGQLNSNDPVIVTV